MELPRTARKPIEVDVTATLANGDPAALGGAKFALCDHGGPTATTVWVGASYDQTGGVAGLDLADSDATDISGALVNSSARAELWALGINGPIVDPVFIDTVERP